LILRLSGRFTMTDPIHTRAREAAMAHLALTHPGYKMETAGSLVIDILLKVLNGISLKAAILEEIAAQRHPLLGHPFKKWLDDPEQALIVNTNLGGENAARGSVLGALLGASCGMERFPRRWFEGLIDPPSDISPN